MHFNYNFQQIMEMLPAYLESQGIDASGMFSCIHPNHNDSKPSAHIYKNVIKCFGCGAVMTIFDAAHYLEALPKKGEPNFFRDNVSVLAQRFGIALPKWSESTSLDIHASVIDYTMNVYTPRILEERNITLEEYYKEILVTDEFIDFQLEIPVTIKLPPLEETFDHLLQQGYTQLQIKLAGYRERNDLNNFGIFPREPALAYPLWLSNSVCVGFNIKNPSGEPKYINTPNSDCFTKSQYLYGIFMNPKIDKPLYIVEGQKDCLALWKRNYQAVATLGSYLTEDQIEIILNRGFKQVTLCPDADNGGFRGSIKSIEELLKRGIMCSLVKLPNNNDPYDYLIDQQNTNLPDSISGIQVYTDHLKEIGDLHTVTAQVINIISQISTRVQREIICKEFSKHLDVSDAALQEDVETLIKQRNNARNASVLSVFERGLERAKNSPEEAVKIMQQGLAYAEELNQVSTSFNNDFTLDLINGIRDGKANNQHLDIHFRKTGLAALSDMWHHNGIGWTSGTLAAVGGDPSCGKSAITLQIGVESLIYAPDTMILHFSTDDASRILMPRIISSLIFNPDFYIGHSTQEDLTGTRLSARTKAIKKIQEWAATDRLVMRDQNFGSTLSKFSNLVKYYRDKYPDRRMILINDNFHKNTDYSERDTLTKQRLLADDAKQLAVTEKLCFLCTVEYRKNKNFIGHRTAAPSTSDIKGDGSLSFNANIIMNLYNDFVNQNSDIDNSSLVHEYNGELFPRVIVNVSKNKVSGITGPIAMNLFPRSSFFQPVDNETAFEEQNKRLQMLGD